MQSRFVITDPPYKLHMKENKDALNAGKMTNMSNTDSKISY